MAIQATLIFAEYYFDNEKLFGLMIFRETSELAKGFRLVDGELRYALPDDLGRYSLVDSDYITRIRTPAGDIIYTDCDSRCDDHLLPPQVNPPDFWARRLTRGKPISGAGGKLFELHGKKALIEIAILKDSSGVMWMVLREEFLDHLVVPMSIMLFLVLGGALFSLHRALKPVSEAARQAGDIDPLDPSHLINQAGMPREIAELAAAVNRSLSRIGILMKSQRLFTTAVAHEIRTPLAMMKLELGNIQDPRARKMEGDIDTLAGFVSQITALGRLESADRAVFKTVSLSDVARQTVTDMAPWVYDKRHTIAYTEADDRHVDAHAPLLEDALRNLIENAVKHTPSGTAIEVIAGPGTDLCVRDNAGHYVNQGNGEITATKADHLGVGLEIVRRIMTLHRGRLEIEVMPNMNTYMFLRFSSTTQANDSPAESRARY
jgi:signal transduction histidine kinase